MMPVAPPDAPLAALKTELSKLQIVHETLLAIFDAVNTTDDLSQLYGIIHHQLGNIFDVSNFYIALYDQDRDCITFAYYVDEMDEYFPTVHDISKKPSVTAEVIRQKRPLRFVKSDFLLRMVNVESQALIGTPCEIWIGAPLRIGDTVIGVIAVQNYHDPEAFTDQDLEALDSVSFQVALAIERKKAAESLRAQERQYRALIANIPSIIFATNTQQH